MMKSNQCKSASSVSIKVRLKEKPLKALYGEGYKAFLGEILSVLSDSTYHTTQEDLEAIGNELNLFTNLREHIDLIKFFMIQYHAYVCEHKVFAKLKFPEAIYLDKQLLKYQDLFLKPSEHSKINLTEKAFQSFIEGIQRTRNNNELNLGFEIDQSHGWHPKPTRKAFKKISEFMALYPFSEKKTLASNHFTLTQADMDAKFKDLFLSFKQNFKARAIKNKAFFERALDNHEPVPLMLTVPGHGVGSMIYKDWFVYVNTGTRGFEGEHLHRYNQSGAWYFKIKEGAQKVLLERLLESKFESMNGHKQFLFELEQQGLLQRKYVKRIEQQKTGDCSFRAFKFLFPAAMSLNLVEHYSPNVPLYRRLLLGGSKVLMAALMGISRLVKTLDPNKNHTIWFMDNLLSNEFIKFHRCTQFADQCFEIYFKHYQAEKLSEISATESTLKNQPKADIKTLLTCFDKFKMTQSSQFEEHAKIIEMQTERFNPEYTKLSPV